MGERLFDRVGDLGQAGVTEGELDDDLVRVDVRVVHGDRNELTQGVAESDLEAREHLQIEVDHEFAAVAAIVVAGRALLDGDGDR